MSNTQQTLAQMVRAKYPNAYTDLSDTALEQAVLSKHPEYSDLPRTKTATIGPQQAGAPSSVPGAELVHSAYQKLQEIQNLTQEGKAEHPIQAKIGEVVNNLEGFLFGTKHGESAIGTGQTGMLTNPVTAALTPGEGGVPAAASAAESAANLVKGGYQAAKGGVQALKEAIPSTERAGVNFQQLSETIGEHPVGISDDLSESINALRKASTTTNTNIPPVVKKLIDRLDPFQGGAPLTYDEARAFSSEVNQLSAADKMSMTPNTKRLVGGLNVALKDAVQETADLAGKGEKLSFAMKDYRNAMKLRNLGDTVKEELWKAILTGAGIYGARKIWDAAAPLGKP